MKIVKDHINNIDHPINKIISFFNKLFCKYINDRIKDLEYQLEKDTINHETFDSSTKTLEKEITDSFQEFIYRMHSTVNMIT